jgi:hypothetical protein
VILSAIKNNLVPPIRRLHRTGSNVGQRLIAELRQGRIVIVDTSLLGSEEAFAVSGLLLKGIFDFNRRHFTDPAQAVVRCLAVIEEAQAVLGNRDIDDRNIFVRWVKEGRKYDLGVILITQQPGAIADQIISQGDNFFVLHLLNDADLATLKRHNAYFADDILGVIRSEPIPGNCYFWSAPDQPFVLPVRVPEFGRDNSRTAGAPKTAKRTARPRVLADDLEGLLLGILGSHPSVWLYPVATPDGQAKRDSAEIAFAFDYLVNSVASRLRDTGAPHAGDDPGVWLHQELPLRVDQTLATLGGRQGYAILASAMRKVWVLRADVVPLSGGKKLRTEMVEVRAAI